MEPVTFLPLALVAIFALAFPDGLRRHAAVRLAVVAALGVLVLRYLAWRLPVTVLPAVQPDLQSVLVWTLFAIEILAWLDAAILFAALCRRTERSPEADRHERRLRALPPDRLPSVDVFIATYNEPLEVLERTIIGALAIDWPDERRKLWVLDDGRRDWLRDYCAARGVGYLTRPDNVHAKAGNINAAIRRTTGDLIAILDADFIPQPGFLYRMAGFFEDPRIGIVQAPHRFFNHDPMQANLALRRSLPGDQSLFFGEIMPGRDGWDCAFCCGSNSLTRRSALEAIGNALPTGSITEDMLLTLALLRKGYVTRYLNERLAIGLAPESLDAFFIQRARWARGALQILYLREGPLGPGLRLHQRLMFLPTHWLTQALTQVAALSAPCLYLLTGLLPMLNVTADAVISYQMPAILGTISVLRFFAPAEYFPLASTVLGVLQSFRFLPTLLWTLIRPHGHAFRVTPKGRGAAGHRFDRFTVGLAGGLLVATAGGFLLNSDLDWRVIGDVTLFPVVAFWCSFNAMVLLVVLVTAISAPAQRAEERFLIRIEARLRLAGRTLEARTRDLSLGGAALQLADGANAPVRGTWLALSLSGIGEFPARVVRAEGCTMAVEFRLPPSEARDRLIRRIFTSGADNETHNDDALTVTLGMIASIFRDPPAAAAPATDGSWAPPPDLLAEIAVRRADTEAWIEDASRDGAAGHRPEPAGRVA